MRLTHDRMHACILAASAYETAIEDLIEAIMRATDRKRPLTAEGFDSLRQEIYSIVSDINFRPPSDAVAHLKFERQYYEENGARLQRATANATRFKNGLSQKHRSGAGRPLGSPDGGRERAPFSEAPGANAPLWRSPSPTTDGMFNYNSQDEFTPTDTAFGGEGETPYSATTAEGDEGEKQCEAQSSTPYCPTKIEGVPTLDELRQKKPVTLRIPETIQSAKPPSEAPEITAAREALRDAIDAGATTDELETLKQEIRDLRAKREVA